MMRFYALMGIILFFFTFSVLPTTINGRFTVLNSTSSEFTVLFQVNTNTGVDDLGGSTMVFGFDTAAISFTSTPVSNVDYIFHNFSGGNYSSATITKPMKNRIWVNIDLPFVNSNNGTVISSSPQWTDVVTINFNVENPNITPGLSWLLTSAFWGIYDADNITLWETGLFEGNFGLEVVINNGWNAVSVPGINPDGQGVNEWWSGKDPAVNVFKMLGNYIPVTTTIPGEGYWMKHLGNKVYNTGDEWPAGGIQRVPHYPIAATAGWNLIGGYETAVATTSLTTTPPGLITGIIYGYSDNYQIVTTLEPGRGYFVKLNGAGQINMPGGFAKGSLELEEYFNEDWGRIILTDASGSSFVLYLVNDEVDLNLFELPPIPPEGAFDIRFASGRIAENLDCGTQTILLSGIMYPINVQVENVSITLQDQSRNKLNADLIPGEEITVTNESIDKLLILSDKSETPISYNLEQNYPNPFNPSTTIKFAVTKESNVNLSIYNVLGELVTTLVNEQLKTGYHQYEFNASDLASGVYIYRIIADDFVETKKMVLLR
ncbi:MAG TPA: T9SS type A sorting domain-containing protein [Ignavibacteriaceae bacterium]|nr:T9SS type A sorting domain-containing protein [Ignavibacteriaceae bacterium]